ncbi:MULTISPECIES: hypothetical protein [unclassified Duganella]|uniref:hypothetical protein n=1 Tax=unclassified Duganella TaxID=2636909 RepID=UPI000E354BD6|nr:MULTISPECIES: hypothetical protein [unclassified Duganella]RFP14644.1 hypothetical protein D0T23_11610 [Duganella sp. BJB475]RFP30992.1 hypothetical protein D0T21_13990 [Duganella sp. BJB476]
MAIDRSNPIFLAPSHGGHNPELMLSAVLHLMSHYTAGSDEAGGCVKLASVIERHLKALASLPDLAPVLSATCQQLSEQWAGVVERNMHLQEKSNFLSRIMARARIAPATV